MTGLSTIDGASANENGTTSYISYKTGQWYKVRVRVTDDKIQAWLDDKQIVDQDHRKVDVGIRISVSRCRPLGICAFETRALFRNIQLVTLEEDE